MEYHPLILQQSFWDRARIPRYLQARQYCENDQSLIYAYKLRRRKSSSIFIDMHTKLVYRARTRGSCPKFQQNIFDLPGLSSPRFILNFAKIGELRLKQAVLYTRYVDAIGCTWNFLLLGIRGRGGGGGVVSKSPLCRCLRNVDIM